MPTVKFQSSYSSTSELMTGAVQPDDVYERESVGEGGRPRTETLRGRIFRAAPGETVELSEEQVEFVRRDAPGALGAK